MPKRILDTNVLILNWRRLKENPSEVDIKNNAGELIKLQGTKWIVSPVKVEFLCGADTKAKTKQYQYYLSFFEVLDEQRTPALDWFEAERIACRIPTSRKARKMGDCLIQAIAARLKADIITADRDFSPRIPPETAIKS